MYICSSDTIDNIEYSNIKNKYNEVIQIDLFVCCDTFLIIIHVCEHAFYH